MNPKSSDHTCVWPLYEFASTGFTTTILMLVFPVYYEKIILSELTSPAQATYYWSISLITALSLSSLFAIVLGMASDLVREKGTLLLLMTAGGALSSGMLVVPARGEVLFASILFVVSYSCYLCSYMLYESILCHLPPGRERHEASTRGFAMNYLGGLILTVLNLVLLYGDPEPQDYRCALLISSLWWAVLSVPFFFRLRTLDLERGEREMRPYSAAKTILRRFSGLFREISREREVVKFMLAYLALFVGINTLTCFGPIYGAEIGLQTTELVLAVLLAQVTGIPFTFIIGRLPGESRSVRSVFFSIIVLNAMLVPAAGTLLSGAKSAIDRTMHATGKFSGLVAADALLSPDLHALAESAAGFMGQHPVAGFCVLLALMELIVVVLSLTAGRMLFSGIVEKIDLRATILLCLSVYAVSAIWGSIIRTSAEFWLLCFMISIVHGGCQALSRSAYSFMVPKSRSGELFGVLSAVKTIATMAGPLLIAVSSLLFSSSRPGMFSLAFMFVISAAIFVRTVIENRIAASAT